MRILSTLVLLCISTVLYGQKVHHDTTLKNTVRINITPMLLTGKLGSFTAGYERVLNHRQTISANIGHLQLPSLIKTKEGAPVEWVNSTRNTGFLAAVDYRFYFSRNKYQVPDGLYWGPYATYYYFDNAADINLINNGAIDAGANLQMYASMLMVGVQMGYQFVLWNRLTVDFVLIGPGMGFYDISLNLKAHGEITGNEDYLQGVYDAVVGIFPGAERLFDTQKISETGRTSFNAAGFRYLIQIGYRF